MNLPGGRSSGFWRTLKPSSTLLVLGRHALYGKDTAISTTRIEALLPRPSLHEEPPMSAQRATLFVVTLLVIMLSGVLLCTTALRLDRAWLDQADPGRSIDDILQAYVPPKG